MQNLRVVYDPLWAYFVLPDKTLIDLLAKRLFKQGVIQGRNDGAAREVQFPRRRMTMGMVRRITAGGAEKSQQYREYFLHYSTFASERP